SRSQSGSNGQGSGQTAAQGQGGEMGDGGEQSGSGGSPGEDGGSGDSGDGGGFSTGGQNQNGTGVSGLDTITRPEQVANGGQFTPDESTKTPYLGEAGDGAAQACDDAVQPSFTPKQ